MKVCFVVLEPHFGCQFVPPVSFTQSILDFRPFGVARDRFWILDYAESALKSKKSVRDARPPFFHSSSSQQNSDCQLELPPTTVCLAPSTHPGERSISSIGTRVNQFYC